MTENLAARGRGPLGLSCLVLLAVFLSLGSSCYAAAGTSTAVAGTGTDNPTTKQPSVAMRNNTPAVLIAAMTTTVTAPTRPLAPVAASNTSSPASDDGFNTLAVIGAVIAFLGVVVACGQFRVGANQRRQTEVQLLRTVTQDWRDLADHWKVAMMGGRGVGDYYIEVPHDDQMRYLALKRRAIGHNFHVIGENWQVVPREIAEKIDRLSDTEAVEQLRIYEVSFREALDFLAQVGGRVLAGDLKVRLAYDALGATILNNAAAIRNLFRTHRYQDVVPGHSGVILALIDLLWVYGLKVGNIPESDAYWFPRRKRETGSGLRNRLRVRYLAKRYGGRWWTALRLEYLLTYAEAEHPSTRSRVWVLAKGRPHKAREKDASGKPPRDVDWTDLPELESDPPIGHVRLSFSGPEQDGDNDRGGILDYLRTT